MAFSRRYQYFPGTEVITQIEGIIIVDLPPPGAFGGVGTGVVAVVGEFPDMKYAVSVNTTTGVVTTNPQPVEVYSSQDMIDKVGGFDETIGDTGASGGNGFITIRNKRFQRLVIVPINLASGMGVRLWRQLPTNTSATDPTPVVPVIGATVAAGREFRNGTSRVRLATKHAFTGLGVYKQAVDGAVTAAGAGVTQLFTSATGGFLTAKNGGPVKEGDLLVLGVIDAAGAQGANADTYRVVADATVATQLTVQKLDGSSWDWTSGTALAYRIQYASDGDSGLEHQLSEAPAYLLPARPLDATIAASTTLAPTAVPPAATATTWDPLSGLKMRTDASTGLVYDADVQAANAVSHADLSALYVLAIESLLSDDAPANEVNILICSRHSDTITSKIKSHVLTASGQGVGRTAQISPALTTVSTSTVFGDAAPGVGASRDERIDYVWPGFITYVPEAVGFSMKGADGFYYTDGIIDTHGDAWLASVLSLLPPERNPGQATSPVPEILSNVLGLQRATPKLDINIYTQCRQKGVVAGRYDRATGGYTFQSGITTSLTSGQKNIARRRIADFIEDSLSQILQKFSKQPLTTALKDAALGEVDAFLATMLSTNNPPAQRISAYSVDDKSGNTPTLEAQGIHVIIANVRSLATADFIVIQANIGEAVVVTAT